ncbi:exodeoxyribonuclease III [Blautia sp. XA-2221]|uniref:exodeoxyribonuclease III n=1 Tax=Blautia sp. XA-2221 TaxID=2903961 RepID=UPI00237813FA|nr:exodeoxyribonuclease III [Blautia sp. XA-2221]
MKLISWNVNGIRACITKGFEESFQKLDADIFCIQETKCQENQVKLELPGYYQYWNFANRKGYSGTAVFTRQEPLNVVNGIGIEEHDKEGRVITLEFEKFYLVTVYTPNSQSELRRLSYRMEWERDFLAYLLKLQEKKPVVCCGDFNVAVEDIDIKNPQTNHNSAGFTDAERSQFRNLLASGFTDTYRYLHPDEVKYSWWSYRFKARERNAGWRLDYFLLSDFVNDKIINSEIMTDIYGSDHCPVELDLNI